MKSKNIIILLLIVFVIIFVILNVFLINRTLLNKETSKQQTIAERTTPEGIYNPQINPEDYVSEINNKYLTFTPGKKLVYEGKTEEGVERVEVAVTHETKKVMGVNTIVVWDRVWLNDELIEDTKDWYAQDKYGNVWYFGEDSKELVNGKVVNAKGSWKAGVDGAKPGIVMKANPQVGDNYRQEYYKGEAEDMGEVVALGVKVKLGYGTFTNCLQTRDWTPLEPSADEYKYYCPEVSGLVYEVNIGDGEETQLIDVEKSDPNKQIEIKEDFEYLKTEITEQEAVAIAQKEVQGKVTNVAIEKKYGKAAYVIEIDAYGVETDVVIDIETGKVLGIET